MARNRPKETILIVDPDAHRGAAKAVVAALAASGHRAIAVKTSPRALDVLRRSSVDAAVIRLRKPRGAGEELCKAIKGDPKTRSVVVLLDNGSRQPGSTVADDLVLGKISPGELAARVRFLTRLKHMRDALGEKQSQIDRAYRGLHRASFEIQRLASQLDEHDVLLAQRKAFFEMELAMAREIQEGLFPRPAAGARVGEVLFAVKYAPSGSVGGDFCNVMPLPDSSTGFYLADVAGHGLPAAFIAAMGKMAFEAYALSSSPREAVRNMNSRLCQVIRAESYVTLFFGVRREKENKLVYVCAGHPPGLLLSRRRKKVLRLEAGGTVIGALPEAPYEENAIGFSRGDRLLLFTDGAMECRSRNGERFGVERVEENLVEGRDLPPREFLDRLYGKIQDFVKAGNLQDDVTLFLLEVAK